MAERKTIYLDDALEAIRKLPNAGIYWFVSAEAVFNALLKVPSAQPEQQWIPCSERLPENGEQVLVYARSVHYALAKYDKMREVDGTYKKQWVTFDAWKPFYTIKEVIAWMPLPEQWKGE